MKNTNADRIILAGGSGFIGSLLTRYLLAHGKEVIVLSRQSLSQPDGMRQSHWDGCTLGPWAEHLNGARAVINLAGRSVNCRYTSSNRRLIMESRVNSTRVLGEAIAGCATPPPVWLNSSTATIYKHSLIRPMDEAGGEIGDTAEAKDAFSVAVACEWEKTFEKARAPATRKIALRTAMVMGAAEGGVFHVLCRLVRFGLGGKMADGKQFVSWIHEEDFCRAIEWLLSSEALSGPINIASPNPVTNQELMAALRQTLGIPIGLPAARWMLELGAFFLRTETDLILKSRRVIPGRLVASGFEFRFPKLVEAAKDLSAR